MKNQVLFFLFIFLFNGIVAQETSFIKQIKTGINFGIGHSKTNASFTDWQQNGLVNELNGIKVNNSLNYKFGLSFLKDLDDFFAVRLNTEISFWSTSLEYDFINLEDHKEELQPVSIEFPLSLIYTIRKFKRIQPSIIMGFRQIRGIGKTKGNKLTYQNANLYVETGIGLEIDLNKILIRPEISFAIGIQFYLMWRCLENYENKLLRVF
ncbi:MAG: hypothetical protein R2825_25760 [Saprospiraceae bacterium]